MMLLRIILSLSCFLIIPLSAMDDSKDMPSKKQPLTFEGCNTNFQKYNDKLREGEKTETLIGVALACTKAMKTLAPEHLWKKGYKKTKESRKKIYTNYKENFPQNNLKQLGLIDEELSDSEKNETKPYDNFKKLLDRKKFSITYSKNLEQQATSLQEKIKQVEEKITNEEKSADELTKKRKAIELQKDIENNQIILEKKVQEILDLKKEKKLLETNLEDIELFKKLIEHNINTQHEQAEKQLQDTNNNITELSNTIQTLSKKLNETNTNLLNAEETNELEALKQQKNELLQNIKNAEKKLQEQKKLLQEMKTKKEYMEQGTSRTWHTLTSWMPSMPSLWSTSGEKEESSSSSSEEEETEKE